MPLTNIIDLIDAILSYFQFIFDIERLDINISIGMIFRLIFFIVAIMLRDLNQYTVGEFIAQIVAWLIFHVYIIYFERIYFDQGESRTQEREKRFKLMDTLQLIIGTLYIALTFNSVLEILTLVFFSINLFLNILELIYICFFKSQHVSNFQKVGGYCQLMIGFLLGLLCVIVFLIWTASKYWEVITKQELFPFIIVITIGGEILAFLFFAFLFCSSNADFVWTTDWTKGRLGFLYGFNVGLFSIFYGFLIGMAVVLYITYYCCKSYREAQLRQQNNPQAVQTAET